MHRSGKEVSAPREMLRGEWCDTRRLGTVGIASTAPSDSNESNHRRVSNRRVKREDHTTAREPSSHSDESLAAIAFQECSKQADTVCESCPDGSFKSRAANHRCTECSSCAAGSEILAECTATSDTRCAGCGDNTFSDDEDEETCTACQPACEPGETEVLSRAQAAVAFSFRRSHSLLFPIFAGAAVPFPCLRSLLF